MTSIPFSERDYKRFGIDILNKNNIEVFVYDCSGFLNKQFNAKYFNVWHYPFKNHKVITSHDELTEVLKKDDNQKSLFVDLLFGAKNADKIKRHIKNNDGKIVSLYLGLRPEFKVSHKKNNILSKLKIIIKSLVHYLKEIVMSENKIKPDIVLASGEYSHKKVNMSGCKIIWAHSLDYDLYLENNNKATREDHVLFVDQNLIKHSDFELLGIDSPVSESNYYSSLNKYFNQVERLTNLPVVIAEHPRTIHEDLKKHFDNRKIVKGNTAELIRDSKLVLIHISTSINLAVLWEKPIILLTTNEIMNSRYNSTMENYSKELSIPIHKIDENILTLDKYNRALLVNKDAYENFRKNYIKRNMSKNSPVWQIVSEYINGKEYANDFR